MEIRLIKENKKQFLDLLLLADEQESMIDNYLERGELFALYDNGLRSICVVTDEGDGIYELQNLATCESYQGQGYGKRLVGHISDYYCGRGSTMLVGTGDVPWIVSFYQQCGFVLSHRLENFFVEHYDHPIFDGDIQLIDKVFLRKELTSDRTATP